MHIHIDEKTYGEKAVLRDVVLDLQAGEGAAIRGSSGIGKSTLLRIVAGLDHHFSGQIQGRPERIGMVFQEPFLMNWRSAFDNIVLFTGCGRAAAEAALRDVGLEGLGGRLPQELSIGQQRRVSLARALAYAPDLLILDEAFASLDHETAGLMRALVAQYVRKHKAMLLMATHQDDDLDLAKNVYAIEDGRLVNWAGAGAA